MLRLRAPLGEGETVASYCSRLAAMNGETARGFCLDMGLRFQDVVDGDPEALAHLERLSGLDSGALSANAFRWLDGRLYLHRGETIPRTMLRRSHVHVCPACLAADLERWPTSGNAAPYGRAEWLVTPLRTCQEHGMALVEVADEIHPGLVHDFAKLIQGALKRLDGLTAKSVKRRPSRLETYLRGRLAGAASAMAPWLNALPFYAAAKLCEVVGAVERHGPQVRINELTDHQWWAAGDTGYSLMAEGPDGMHGLLDRLSAPFWSRTGGTGPKALFGRLYEWLAHETEDTAYDPARAAIREHVMATLPVGPGDDIFGQPVTERRLHSIRSAQMATGAHPKRLRKLLTAGGFIDAKTAELTDDRVVFPADDRAEGFLERVGGAMPLKEAGAYLNAPRVQMQLLLEHGLVVPFVRGGTDIIKDHAFARVDLDDFLARLTADARLTDNPDLVDIPTAARQSRCSAADIVRLLIDRRLTRVGRTSDTTGYMAVLVAPDEVRPLVHRQRVAGLSMKEVERRMSWSQDVVKALVVHGHLPSQVVQNPVNHLRQTVIEAEDLDAFASRYVSLHGLAKEKGVHFSRLKAALESADVRPAFDTAVVPATFYRRDDLPPDICRQAA